MLDRPSYPVIEVVGSAKSPRLFDLTHAVGDPTERIPIFVSEARSRTMEFMFPFGAEDMADLLCATLKARWTKRAWHRFLNGLPDSGFSYASVAVIPHTLPAQRLWYETDAEISKPGVSICGFYEEGSALHHENFLGGMVLGLHGDFYRYGGVRPEIISPFHTAAIEIESGATTGDLASKQVASFLELRRATSDLHNISFAVARL